MDSKSLYNRLEEDFNVSSFIEEWPDLDSSLKYILPDFIKAGNGLMVSNSKQTNKVYTSVFPSRNVLMQIISGGIPDALLVTHHPMEWDVRHTPVWTNLGKELAESLEEMQISIYSMHLPIDVFGPYSTAVTFARALDIQIEGEFFTHEGVKVAVYGESEYANLESLKKKAEQAVGHQVRVFPYGGQLINDKRVGVIPGGRPKIHNMQELLDQGINTLVTGIGGRGPHTEKDHYFAENNGINIIGATHYSTEKFACNALVDYFGRIGLDARFIEDVPCLEDSNIR